MILEIDLLLQCLFHEKKNKAFEDVLKEKVRFKTAEAVDSCFRRNDKETDKHLEGGREELLNGLKDAILKLDVVKLTIAFEPTEKSIEEMHLSLSKVLEKKTLLQIYTDFSFLGGATVVYKGKYFDASLKKKMETIESDCSIAQLFNC